MPISDFIVVTPLTTKNCLKALKGKIISFETFMKNLKKICDSPIYLQKTAALKVEREEDKESTCRHSQLARVKLRGGDEECLECGEILSPDGDGDND